MIDLVYVPWCFCSFDTCAFIFNQLLFQTNKICSQNHTNQKYQIHKSHKNANKSRILSQTIKSAKFFLLFSIIMQRGAERITQECLVFYIINFTAWLTLFSIFRERKKKRYWSHRIKFIIPFRDEDDAN